jgi:Rrf2 family iron-sulfur cluster assembly transcriptional regulator
MTVIFSKKCELALQAVLFLSADEDNRLFNAGDISKQLDVPKEFVSKVLQTLTSNGIIYSRKGKNGGFSLAKKPADIRLIDIVLAIDGLEIFHKCVLGFPGCSVEKPCPVHDKWGKLREDTYKMLSEETLEDLRDKTITKIESIKARKFFD